MHTPPRGRALWVMVGAIAALQWTLTAQPSPAGKRPLSYDVVDSWKAIQGTELSHDGQWLAYATSAYVLFRVFEAEVDIRLRHLLARSQDKDRDQRR